MSAFLSQTFPLLSSTALREGGEWYGSKSPRSIVLSLGALYRRVMIPCSQITSQVVYFYSTLVSPITYHHTLARSHAKLNSISYNFPNPELHPSSTRRTMRSCQTMAQVFTVRPSLTSHIYTAICLRNPSTINH